MPIFKVICNEEFRDDFYELKISEKIMFTVQLILAIATLITTLLSDVDEDYKYVYILTASWNVIECLFCVGGIIVFHFLYRPTVILYLCLMFIHLIIRIVYILVMLIQLHRATLHIALVALSAILSLVQLWAAFLLFKILRNRNAHGYNTYMYIPDKPKKQVQSNDDVWT